MVSYFQNSALLNFPTEQCLSKTKVPIQHAQLKLDSIPFTHNINCNFTFKQGQQNLGIYALVTFSNLYLSYNLCIPRPLSASSFTSKPVKMLFSFPVGLLPTNNLKKYITLPPDYRTYATVKGLGYVLEVE